MTVRSWPKPTLPILIAIVAVTARLTYVVSLADEFPVWRDSQHYVAIATSLVEHGRYHDVIGAWPGEPMYGDVGPTSFWLPGYPVFLAIVFGLFGKSVLAVRLAQAAASVATVWLTWLVGVRVGGRQVGLTAALLMAINPLQIYVAGNLASEVMTGLLIILAVFLRLRLDDLASASSGELGRSWVALNVILAIGVLTRSMLIPVSAVLLFGALRHFRSRVSGRRLLALTAAAVLSWVVVLSPWLARNYLLWGQFVYHTKSGINMAMGHNDAAAGHWDLAMLSHIDWPDPAIHDELQRDRLLRRQAIEWAAAHPAQSAYLAVRKITLFWSPIPGATQGALRYIGLAWSAMFLLGALGGLVFVVREDGRVRLLLLVIVAYSAPIVLAFAVTRFRLPMDALLAVLVGVAIERGRTLACSVRSRLSIM